LPKFRKTQKKAFRDGNNEKKDRLQPIYIVIYPYIASDFIYDLLELDYMKNNGIDCRQMINPVHHADHFKSQFENNEFLNSVNIS